MQKPGETQKRDRTEAEGKPAGVEPLGAPASLPACWLRTLLAALMLAIASLFIFTRLGHYALWDDEANTALIAKGVWQTGDTTAVIGPNLVAYRNGWTLKNLRERATPPLSFYLAAPFIGCLGETALAARLPFALCGLGCVLLMVWWLARAEASLMTWLLTGLGLLGNVSFFLFCRQARYYALAMLLSATLAWLYLHRERRWKLAAFALVSAGLFATQYLLFAAVSACVLVDYFVWGRKEHPLGWRGFALVFIPQLVLGAVIFAIWNPFTTGVAGNSWNNSLLQKLTLFWWNLRDLNRAEFGVGLLLLAAPVVGLVTREKWLLRGSVAVLIYAGALSLISVQPVRLTVNADIRYLTPLLPLCIALGALCLKAMTKGNPWRALPLAAIAFGTSLFHGSWFAGLGPARTGLHSSIQRYVHELISPPGDPYTVAAEWINQNVKPAQSVLVAPDYMTYPLMYHAPRAVYAWQLEYPPSQGQFRGLASIHYFGQTPPDFVILFGMRHEKVLSALRALGEGVEYSPVERLNHFWAPTQRPELFARAFGPITQFDLETQAIYIFRRSAHSPQRPP